MVSGIFSMLTDQKDLWRINIMSDEHEDKRHFKPKAVSTTIIDDVFTDSVAIVKTVFKVDYDACLGRLWEANPEIHSILKEATDLESARNAMYSYLERSERAIFNTDNDLHI